MDPGGDGLQREQVRLLCQAMSRAPVVNVIVVSFICFIVWRYAASWAVAAWAGLVFLSEYVRARYARRALANPPADPRAALRTLERIALFVGCARGSAMPLFFMQLPPVAHAALSVAFLGFCAGGLSTHGPHARAFHFFAAPMLAAMAIAWVYTRTTEGIVLAILFAVFALMIASFARAIETLVRDSFLIRHERDRLVRELVEARDRAEQANDAKSRFLAAASHDLRQPLHALSLFSATLSMRAATPEVREVSDGISGTQKSLTALVDALLDISKLDAQAVIPELENVNLDGAVEQALLTYRPAAVRKGLVLEAAGSGISVRTDPMLLQRVMTNLIDNAIKYTAAGGVRVEVYRDGGAVELAVVDTGEGIPEAERARIFEEFYQIGNPERDRTRGLGLGLAIVRRVCRLLGTEVDLRSQVGIGSRFSFRLPVAEGAVVARPEGAVAGVDLAPLNGRSVLVIDDESAVRTAMRTLLEAWEMVVLTCGGLAEAEVVLAGYPQGPDLIVADFRLREGESGVATVLDLRRRLGPVPAIIISGDTAPERLREAQASGLLLLHKPIAAAELAAAIGRELAT